MYNGKPFSTSLSTLVTITKTILSKLTYHNYLKTILKNYTTTHIYIFGMVELKKKRCTYVDTNSMEWNSLKDR